jgi:hypothetical protein
VCVFVLCTQVNISCLQFTCFNISYLLERNCSVFQMLELLPFSCMILKYSVHTSINWFINFYLDTHKRFDNSIILMRLIEKLRFIVDIILVVYEDFRLSTLALARTQPANYKLSARSSTLSYIFTLYKVRKVRINYVKFCFPIRPWVGFAVNFVANLLYSFLQREKLLLL